MASVKEEVKEEMESDIWLSSWANADNEKVKQEEDEKPNLSATKLEVDDETLKPKQKKKDQNCKVLARARRTKEENDTIVHTKKSKENIKEKANLAKRDNCLKSGLVDKQHISSLLQTALEHATHADKIANLCKYQCPKCNKVYSLMENLSRHCKKQNMLY